MKFCGVEWGSDDSKGDNNLSRYFVKIPEFDQLKQGRLRYVVGRKGTGKTALLEKIRHDCEQNPSELFYYNLSLRNFPLNNLARLQDKSLRDKSKYVPAWMFLIIIEVCNFIIYDESIADYQVKQDIANFIRMNFPNRGTIAETVNFLSSNESKVNVMSTWLAGC